jgi:hypothetical protein
LVGDIDVIIVLFIEFRIIADETVLPAESVGGIAVIVAPLLEFESIELPVELANGIVVIMTGLLMNVDDDAIEFAGIGEDIEVEHGKRRGRIAISILITSWASEELMATPWMSPIMLIFKVMFFP